MAATDLPPELEALSPPAPVGRRLALGLGLLPLLGLLLAALGPGAVGGECEPVETVRYTSGARGRSGGCAVREAVAWAAPPVGIGLAASGIAWADLQAGRRRWAVALQAVLGLTAVVLALLGMGLLLAAAPLGVMALVALLRAAGAPRTAGRRASAASRAR